MSDVMEEALAVLHSANCEDHTTDVIAEDVAEALVAARWCACFPQDCGTYCDTYGCAIVRLKDGQFAVIDESSDTSGHG